jgi:hypothetical protein
MLYLSYAATRHQRESGDYYILSGEEIPVDKVAVLYANWRPGVDVVSYPVKAGGSIYAHANADPQYLGTSYLDMVARVLNNLGDWTPAEIASLYTAIWETEDGWISGSAEQWEAAGKLQPVRFTSGVTIQGVNDE